MSIYCINGVWYIRIRSRTLRIHRRATGRTENEAKVEEMLIKTGVRNGTWHSDPVRMETPVTSAPPCAKVHSLSLSEAFQRVFEERWSRLRDDKVTCRTGRIVAYFGAETSIQAIDYDAIQRYVKYMLANGRKPSSVNRHLSALHTMLRMACDDWGIIDKVPKIRMFKEPPGRLRIISASEEKALCKTARRGTGYLPMIADLIPLLMDTGMRLGEALSLKYEDVDFVQGLMHLWKQKGVKARSIPMTKRVRKILSRRRKLDAHAPFSVTRDQTQRAMKWLRKRSGVSDPTICFHAMRHTTASRLVQKGVSLYTVQRLLGHSTIKVTERYAHLAPENLKDAVKLLE